MASTCYMICGGHRKASFLASVAGDGDVDVDSKLSAHALLDSVTGHTRAGPTSALWWTTI